ncbi:MAG TPA: transglutaminase family protein [Geminicoccus sp.]|jgi:transglutaminase-like putative cysteine protease|uniref:transglutaminase-like domain-containing protein n=1 Tax=Geminicoccus sp. TaxID=2024832 RepID=UPI002E32F624|nr:transglutaminase family protein [Geminicoccus sp.]HEX2529827.1 transglutaminase family protein [Geminicoccus sp.]
MRIRIGYEMDYEFPQPTPMILMLHVHWSRVADLEAPDHLITTPSIVLEGYRDSFGNWCTRLTAPAGQVRFSADAIIRDHGTPDPQTSDAVQHVIQDLPADTIMFLLGSRYCDTDHLFDVAWQLFGTIPPGWARVQAICDYVHDHITFGYQHARPTRTAFDAYREKTGVCRDFAHLALALCRCMNIPARYCTGYISDIGFPPPHSPMDFAAWIEVFLGGQWRVFDPRNNSPRIGRILVARGRDAADVPLTHTFGPSKLTGFKVVTDEVSG